MKVLTAKQEELVHTMGCSFVKGGFQPVTGRVMALLMVSDKEQLTFDEIVEELGISKGSASSALKILELHNAIEYVTKPNDRKRYFQIKTIDRFAQLNEYRSKLQETKNILQSIHELKSDKNSRNAVFLNEMIDMIGFFMEKFQTLKDDYIESRKTIQ